MDEERRQVLEKALTNIKKRFGEGAVMRLGEAQNLTVQAIPTGSLTLDMALGVGGIPRGRVTEIYGPEASGKTTLCQHIVAETQRLGGVSAFIDMEHALDPAYAARCGVNVDDLYISQPDTGEQALEIAETLVRSGAVDVVIIDSVAALVPRAEIEGEMGDAPMGMQARSDEPGDAQAQRSDQTNQHRGDLHEPIKDENRCDVWKPRDHDRRPCVEILRLRSPRYASHRKYQSRAGNRRQPCARAGGQEQSRATIQGG